MGRYGIEKKIIRILENLYSLVMACVRISGKETDWFQIITGFRQGCILSPTLFNIILDYIMRRVEEAQMKKETSIPTHCQDVEYADDTGLLAESLLNLIQMIEQLAEESKKLGLLINYNKTKVMPITKKEGPWPKIEIEGKDIEVVRKFTYLGSELEANGGSESEIKRRIALAGATFKRLHQKIFRRHDVPLKLKIRTLNACVIPVLLYGAETWSVTHNFENKLNAAENGWLRRILGISYKEHISNVELRRRTGQPYVGQIIRKRRVKWAGHVLRMDDTRPTKETFLYKPDGKRSRGRPMRRWMDCLEDDLKQAGISRCGRTCGRNRMTLLDMAQDRELWRDVVEKSMAGYSRGMMT